MEIWSTFWILILTEQQEVDSYCCCGWGAGVDPVIIIKVGHFLNVNIKPFSKGEKFRKKCICVYFENGVIVIICIFVNYFLVHLLQSYMLLSWSTAATVYCIWLPTNLFNPVCGLHILFRYTVKSDEVKWPVVPCMLLWGEVCDVIGIVIFLFPFFFQRFQKAIRPLNSWRANNLNSTGRAEERVEPERVEAPFTVTLTDMDFTAMTWETGGEAWQCGAQRWETSVVKTQTCYFVICPQLRVWRPCLNWLHALQGSVEFMLYLYCSDLCLNYIFFTLFYTV